MENEKKKQEEELLFNAVEAGDITRVRTLLDDGMSVHVRNEDGCTPIHVAAKCGQTEVFRLLLDRNGDAYAINMVRSWLEAGIPDSALQRMACARQCRDSYVSESFCRYPILRAVCRMLSARLCGVV
ncbi:hypothetical protein PINS_up016110 [Pythium insidiosum]|nr:hypothetical protein PINS_up016110 [Pythium insidiosum]